MDNSAVDFEIVNNIECNYCNSFSINIDLEYENIQQLIDRIKADGKNKTYDCIIGISGGLDSSYLLVKAVEFGLRPLAVHMDNGWNSELAQSNISTLVRKLNIDLYTKVLDWTSYKQMQLAFIKADVIDIELLYDNAMLATLYEQAKKYGIKYILGGTNHKMEGLRMPLNWVWYKFDGKMIKSICKKFGVSVKQFPMMTLFKWIYYRKISKIKWISMLDYIDFNKVDATSTLVNTYDYKKYPFKHYENVFTRFYQGYILVKKFGIDKRRLHLSNLILSNQLNRDEGLHLLNSDPYEDQQLKIDKQFVLSKLDLSHNDLDEYLNRPAKSHFEFASDLPLHNSLIKLNNLISK
jgi:N-acetyl sugar amidotransferase